MDHNFEINFFGLIQMILQQLNIIKFLSLNNRLIVFGIPFAMQIVCY